MSQTLEPNGETDHPDTSAPAPDHANERLPSPPAPGSIPVLQKLSTTPFPRSGFPLLGIMASVYEHVITVASRMRTTR